MHVFTPMDVADHAVNKYLGVLVAAKYARVLNERTLPGMRGPEKKLTTQALEELTSGDIKYHVTTRRR